MVTNGMATLLSYNDADKLIQLTGIPAVRYIHLQFFTGSCLRGQFRVFLTSQRAVLG